MAEPVGHADRVEQFAGPSAAGVLVEAGELHGQGHVFFGGQVGHEVELLEHEPDVVAAQANQVGFGQGGQGLLADPDLAGVGAVEGAQ